MNKYLVFSLEKRVEVEGYISKQPVPCFELVKEFEVLNPLWEESAYEEACNQACQYSLDNKVRTVVVLGAVFGD